MRNLAARQPAREEPDLYFFGIPDSVHNRAPTAAVFPGALNPALRKNWDGMFKNAAFIAQLQAASSPVEQWGMCIRGFMTAARQAGANPFIPNMTDEDNGRITKTLSAHRSSIHAILMATGLHDLPLLSATPSVLRRKNAGGFTLSVSCKFNHKRSKWPNLDDLSAHARKLGFTQAGVGVYEKNITPETRLYLNLAKERPILGYDIQVSRHPCITSKSMVTKAKYGAFVVGKIWKPLIRANPAAFSRFGV